MTGGPSAGWSSDRPQHRRAFFWPVPDGERQAATVGDQVAGRVGFFLRVEDFEAAYRRMTEAGVTFVREPRNEPYGRVAVFLDIAGNRWDLLGTVQRDQG